MVQYLKKYASMHGLPQTVPPNRHESEPQIVLSSCESKQSGFDTYLDENLLRKYVEENEDTYVCDACFKSLKTIYNSQKKCKQLTDTLKEKVSNNFKNLTIKLEYARGNNSVNCKAKQGLFNSFLDWKEIQPTQRINSYLGIRMRLQFQQPKQSHSQNQSPGPKVKISQDSPITSSLIKDTVADLHTLIPDIKEIHIYSDNAGCYKNTLMMASLRRDVGNKLKLNNFSEAQDGKGRAVDVVSALESVSLVKEALQDVRDNIGEFHAKWYSEILKMADDLDVTPSKPRTCGRQTTRSNVPCESTEDYYKKTIAIPLLDHMLTEMNSRFGDLQIKASMGLQVIPAMISQSSTNDFEYFVDDLPSPSTLEQEMHMWKLKWANESDPPSDINTALQNCNSIIFPNVHQILKICGTFPVTSCECERSISRLRLVKTYFSINNVNKSGLGSPTDIAVVREATAALQSVFPQTELGTFMSLTKRDKERQLLELTMIVTGIRLFNKECGKGGEEIDDCKFYVQIISVNFTRF
ncbi:Cilia- and flagella-associated protein 206 [Mytilus edulis]|uniref:Cilia- and flagella-associated protein 206 n=1 Tax=Mytilus edulis TaxID=6550 RepID=A0A8S3T6I3_MYTED|nr:Cilia- and flagella-associated protein 206 [Mytilus edulis]